MLMSAAIGTAINIPINPNNDPKNSNDKTIINGCNLVFLPCTNGVKTSASNVWIIIHTTNTIIAFLYEVSKTYSTGKLVPIHDPKYGITLKQTPSHFPHPILRKQ